jgi:Flp pilus assembly protein TadD
MREFLQLRLACALCACVAAAVSAVPAAATGSYSPYNETASAALARYVRALASDPKDFDALIGAGRSALELGDAQAAAGFFARADDVNSQSPLPQIGMGAVSVANGDANGALGYFNRAQQRGASVAQFACPRGLAYDLLGQQAQAQADYRVAQKSADHDEATRRLALSLAIAGNRTAALATLSPLMARRDPATVRARAFVLALTGDANGALAAINAAMPGGSARLAPFLQRLTTLGAGEKAAAVNLGIIPDGSGTAYASATPQPLPATTAVASDRLAGIDDVLRAPVPPPAPVRTVQQAWTGAPVAGAAQASYSVPVRHAVQQAAVQTPRRIWLQLATAADASTLPRRFERMKRMNGELFDGIPGYVATSTDKVRLLIGPFKNSNDAETFAEDLASAHITAFQWRNSETDRIVPVVAE